MTDSTSKTPPAESDPTPPPGETEASAAAPDKAAPSTVPEGSSEGQGSPQPPETGEPRVPKARPDKKVKDARSPKRAAEAARKPKAPRPEGDPAPQPVAASSGQWSWGTGRRKSAVARVRIQAGDGKLLVNKRPYDEYFTEERDRKDLMNVLHKTKTAGGLNVFVNVRGGGYTGQAGAIILGLGRALRKYDETLEPILRDNGFLTRDPRKVERKKYGQPGARARFQFSKR